MASSVKKTKNYPALSGFHGWIKIQLDLDINPDRSACVSGAAAIFFYSEVTFQE
jgi:hypothetical protein